MDKIKEISSKIWLWLQKLWDNLSVFVRDFVHIPFFILVKVIFEKNGVINLWLVFLLLIPLFVFKPNIAFNNIFSGILCSAFASFNLSDGYNYYKNRFAKIIAISNLKANTLDFAETIFVYIENICKGEQIRIIDEETPQKAEERKIKALKISGSKGELLVSHNNISRENINKLRQLWEMLVQYCYEYRPEIRDFDFNVGKEQRTKIIGTFSNNLAFLDDANIRKAYSEFILMTGCLDKKIMDENKALNENDVVSIKQSLYILIPCYECLLDYQKEVRKYSEKRNNKYYKAVEKSLK